MRMIAHRPFRDERSVEQFDPACLEGFDGLEIDLRHLTDAGREGDVAVFHAPIFTTSRRARPNAVKTPAGVLERIGDLSMGLYLLDVKTHGAAQRVEEALSLLDPAAEIAFICWHAHEIPVVRAARPDARIFLGVAPVRGTTLTRLIPDDLYVFNGFPYVAGARSYRPRVRQFNQHNINVRRIGPRASRAELPEGVTGLCFHKLFFRRDIAAHARAQGLELAVYGFPSRRDPAVRRLAPMIDFAIVDPDLDGPPARSKLSRRARVLRRRLGRRLKRAGG